MRGRGGNPRGAERLVTVGTVVLGLLLCGSARAGASDVTPTRVADATPATAVVSTAGHAAAEEGAGDANPIDGMRRPAPKLPHRSFIPLPVIATDPNAGLTLGGLPVWLFFDGDDTVRTMLAPDVSRNNLTGLLATFRLFRYPDADRQYSLFAQQSARRDFGYEAAYEHRRLFGGRFFFTGFYDYTRDTTQRFFGFGNTSRDDSETNFATREVDLRSTFGFRITPRWSVAFSENIRVIRVESGSINQIALLDRRFPALPGRDGATIAGHRIGFTYDSRDAIDIPTEGLVGKVYWELARRALGGDLSFDRFGLDVTSHIPFFERRAVAVLRFRTEGVSGGSDVPFYELPRLGGFETLRAFGRGRFVDRSYVTLGYEQRVRVARVNLFNTPAEFELAPFLELGRTFSGAGAITLKDFRPAYGVGLRGLLRPNIVGHVDIGLGKEGPAIFVGLGYPF